jgi:hypothetical protein
VAGAGRVADLSDAGFRRRSRYLAVVQEGIIRKNKRGAPRPTPIRKLSMR